MRKTGVTGIRVYSCDKIPADHRHCTTASIIILTILPIDPVTTHQEPFVAATVSYAYMKTNLPRRFMWLTRRKCFNIKFDPTITNIFLDITPPTSSMFFK